MKAEQDRKQDDHQSGAPVLQRKPGTFVKGDPRINRTLGPKPKAGGAARPKLLRNMRRITRTSPSMDRTQMQRRLRKLFQEDFKGFLVQLRQLEESLRSKAAEHGRNTAGEPNGDHAKSHACRIEDDSRACSRGGDRIVLLFLPWAGCLRLSGKPAAIWITNLPPDFQVIDGFHDRRRGGFLLTLRSRAFSLVKYGEPIPELRPEFGGHW
jgi:hypothetical protein